MSALADFVYGLAKAVLGWGQAQAEKPKEIVHEDQDEKLAQEWRDYLAKHGVHPPLPGARGSLPVGYLRDDGVRDPKNGDPGQSN